MYMINLAACQHIRPVDGLKFGQLQPQPSKSVSIPDGLSSRRNHENNRKKHVQTSVAQKKRPTKRRSPLRIVGRTGSPRVGDSTQQGRSNPHSCPEKKKGRKKRPAGMEPTTGNERSARTGRERNRCSNATGATGRPPQRPCSARKPSDIACPAKTAGHMSSVANPGTRKPTSFRGACPLQHVRTVRCHPFETDGHTLSQEARRTVPAMSARYRHSMVRHLTDAAQFGHSWPYSRTAPAQKERGSRPHGKGLSPDRTASERTKRKRLATFFRRSGRLPSPACAGTGVRP